ncbi:MAG TPA: DUF362 domain-containing protein [Desulfosalsimonadaceae bacterium]|nr:DUF362 domain-containing protein [Desulfosalsimonadaceae bacterium]
MQPQTIPFLNYEDSVPAVLDAVRARERLAEKQKILLKPNLVTSMPHPVTTSTACCRAVIQYIRACSPADIIIAEGTGDPCETTHEVFDKLGYTRLSKELDVPLLDLNTEPVEQSKNPDCPRLPELFLPRIADTHFIISLPVLKVHTLSKFTGSLKNMMGFAPPAHYAGAGGIWNKAAFHQGLQQAIIDLNRYRTPDLTLMDASIGMPDQHLGGRSCDPPVGTLVAGFDALSVDRASAALLGLDWQKIGHLKNFGPVQPK